MRPLRSWIVALSAGMLLTSVGQAVEIKNLRPCFGPLGATRVDTRCVPGDVLFISYDIEGLRFDEKSGKANYTTILELFDKDAKPVFEPKKTPNEVTAQLGGTRMPGELYLIMGRNQTPGKYHVRLTVVDNLAKEQKDASAVKDAIYSFEVLAKQFAFAGVTAQAIGFPGQHYTLNFALVDMSLDEAKSPKVELVMKITDDQGKLVTKPATSNIPADLPKAPDLSEANFLPFPIPIYLNRAGRFTVEVTATDKVGNKTATLKYNLTVADIASMAGK